MTKAILVIDINDDLLEDYENFYVDYQLFAHIKDSGENEFIDRNIFCPLKPMPEKISHSFDSPYDHYDNWKIDGYNECIDEILGGSHE